VQWRSVAQALPWSGVRTPPVPHPPASQQTCRSPLTCAACAFRSNRRTGASVWGQENVDPDRRRAATWPAAIVAAECPAWRQRPANCAGARADEPREDLTRPDELFWTSLRGHSRRLVSGSPTVRSARAGSTCFHQRCAYAQTRVGRTRGDRLAPPRLVSLTASVAVGIAGLMAWNMSPGHASADQSLLVARLSRRCLLPPLGRLWWLSRLVQLRGYRTIHSSIGDAGSPRAPSAVNVTQSRVPPPPLLCPCAWSPGDARCDASGGMTNNPQKFRYGCWWLNLARRQQTWAPCRASLSLSRRRRSRCGSGSGSPRFWL